MKEFHEIEDRIKEKMHDWNPEAPAFVAKAVMAAIKKEPPKRKPIFLLWAIAGVILGTVLLTSGYFLMNSDSQMSEQPTTTHKIENEIALTSKSTNVPANQNAHFNDGTLTTQETDHKPTVQEASKQPTSGAGLNTFVKAQNSNGLSTSRRKSSAIVESEYQDQNEPALTRGVTTSTYVAGQAPALALDSKATTDGNPILNPQLSETKSNSLTISALQTLSSRPLSFIHQPANVIQLPALTSKPFVLDDKSRIKRYANAARFGKVRSLELYGGARYAYTLMQAAAAEHQDYLALRKATERPDLGWELGCRATSVFNRVWVAQAGLQLTQQTRVFSFDEIVVRKSAVQSTTDSIYRTGIVRYKAVYHRLHTLDIPVALGIELRKGLRGVRLSAAAELNLGMRSRGGMMLDETGERVTLTADNAPLLYRAWVGGRVGAQAQFFKTWNGRNRVFFEPAIFYQPMSNTRPANPITEKPLSGSVRLGYNIAL